MKILMLNKRTRFSIGGQTGTANDSALFDSSEPSVTVSAFELFPRLATHT